MTALLFHLCALRIQRVALLLGTSVHQQLDCPIFSQQFPLCSVDCRGVIHNLHSSPPALLRSCRKAKSKLGGELYGKHSFQLLRSRKRLSCRIRLFRRRRFRHIQHHRIQFKPIRNPRRGDGQGENQPCHLRHTDRQNRQTVFRIRLYVRQNLHRRLRYYRRIALRRNGL